MRAGTSSISNAWSRRPGRTSWVPAAVAGLVAFVVVGPAFGRGVVLTYDLAWSPDPRLTSFAMGTAGPAPRAVPSDVVAIVLGQVLGAGLAQALVLWGILVLAGLGASRLAALLAADAGVSGRLVAVVAAIWNPFVLERLVLGHWTVLLAYAAVPHLWVACVRERWGLGCVWAPAAGITVCGAGGANALVIASLAVLPVLAAPAVRRRTLAAAIVATAGASAVWALPALVARVTSAPGGASAFASAADTPLGVLGSLASGGGLWNLATHPPERSSLLVAVVALVVAVSAVLAGMRAARRVGLVALVVPAVAGLVLAWLSALDPFGAWSAVVMHLPGGGILRDAQKLLAPWVAFAAAGSGVLARDLLRVRVAGPALAVLLGALPLALLTSLAWGVSGRVVAVEVPSDLRQAAARLSGAGEGRVGLLPWSQYRRYAWNGDRVSLTLVPRMVVQRVVFDDSLPLASGTVAGEDPAARRVGERIAAGTEPLEALRDEGVRWVVLEKEAGGSDDDEELAIPAGGVVVHDGPSLTVVELPDAPREGGSSAGWAVWLGWGLTGLTWVVLGVRLAGVSSRLRRDRLV